MFELLMSIVCSSTLLILFKLFPSKGVHTPSAITVNYFVGAAISLFTLEEFPTEIKWWVFTAALLGVFFNLVFIIMARTTRENGVAVASLAAKLSMVLPIGLGVFFFNEKLSITSSVGIGLALLAVVFVSGPNKGVKMGVWPLILFLGGGLVDLSISFHTKSPAISEQETPILMALIFSFAFLTGGAIHITEKNFRFRSIPGGLLLGIVNYGSLFFLMKSLNHDNFDSAWVFPINNLGIIITGSLAGILLLKEKPKTQTYIGIGIGLLALTFLLL
jgi:drug/metabolite transporter (DMT)-like permease